MKEEEEKELASVLMNRNEVIAKFNNYGVVSLVDWLEKLDKRVSDIEKELKNEHRK